jgi:hypothetical protein
MYTAVKHNNGDRSNEKIQSTEQHNTDTTYVKLNITHIYFTHKITY